MYVASYADRVAAIRELAVMALLSGPTCPILVVTARDSSTPLAGMTTCCCRTSLRHGTSQSKRCIWRL
jgi:hypothetical protein